MQLRSIFHKTVNRNKCEKFRVMRLAVLQQLRKLKLQWKGVQVFILIIMSAHIFKSPQKPFDNTCQFILFYCVTHFFSYATSLCFLFNSLLNKKK